MKPPAAALSALERAGRSVQPLVFETRLKEVPYSASGTTFLVGFRGRGFVVTTRHSLRPDAPPPLCIFPSRGSRRVLPLKEVTYVPREHIDDEFADLAVIEIDFAAVKHQSLQRASLINMEVAVVNEEEWKAADHFFVLGYPDHLSFVDYNAHYIHSQLTLLQARYAGQSELQLMHELAVTDANAHPSFSGWSGSPVFAWLADHKPAPQLALCGVAIVGSPVSGKVQFADLDPLVSLLHLACEPTPQRAT